MLKRWSLGGFKSFSSKTSLEIAPITVFAGANSSGKSTILQSILLLKQTIQYGSPNRSLALNGPLIRLGTFDDIIHHGSKRRDISIDFEFELDDTPHDGDNSPWLQIVSRQSSFRGDSTLSRIIGSFIWHPRMLASNSNKRVLDKLQSAIKHGSIRVSEYSKRTSTDIEKHITYEEKRNESVKYESESFDWRSASARLDALSKAEIIEGKPDALVGPTLLSFFLPSWIEVTFDAAKKRAKDIADAICGSDTLLTRSSIEGEIIPAKVAQIVNAWLEKRGEAPIELPDLGVPAIELNQRLRRHRRPGPGSGTRYADLASELGELRNSLQTALINAFSPFRDATFVQARSISVTTEFLRVYFRLGIRYLGPLRDEPKPVYPLEALENTADVGYRGEHTAAVLYLHSNTLVQSILPEELENGANDVKPQMMRLKDAVASWTKYMGIATEVIASDAGVFGNQLRVTTEGMSSRQDLTNVGVGVSQVLPIIVSALLAPRTALLIYEQPELHLHPLVQARLADFFYAISLLGKRCVLETHSEYLIDRFRRRIAEEDGERLKSMLAVYFTERTDGVTHCRKVSISKFGAVIDWPRDFFEQGQLETRKILEAASEKRLKIKRDA